MTPFNNIIVTDVDGVLVYWEQAFVNWMHEKKYTIVKHGCYDLSEKYGIQPDVGLELTEEFNSPENIARLPPFKDAIKYVKKLHEEHGFVFHCISAIPHTKENYDARWSNLISLFGFTAFELLILCDRSENKRKLLKEYQDSGCFWCEDLAENCIMGLEAGLNPILVTHHYNTDFNHPKVKRVDDWKQIYSHITGEN
jgi:hypothetical protein